MTGRDDEARRALAGPLYADLAGDIGVSFEFFPPKTDKMEETLWESVKTLEPLAPRFVSVTSGAGGSTQARTHATVARILAETALTPAAHLTCIGASRAEVDAVARSFKRAGGQCADGLVVLDDQELCHAANMAANR